MQASFKQFLRESKQQLEEAATAAPVHLKHYTAFKYNTLVVDGATISIRPQYKLVVEWVYANPSKPQPVSIEVSGNNCSPKTFALTTDAQKLSRWLKNNTKEDSSLFKGIQHV